MTKRRIRLTLTIDDAIVWLWYLDDWDLDKGIASVVLIDELKDRVKIAKETIDVIG